MCGNVYGRRTEMTLHTEDKLQLSQDRLLLMETMRNSSSLQAHCSDLNSICYHLLLGRPTSLLPRGKCLHMFFGILLLIILYSNILSSVLHTFSSVRISKFLILSLWYNLSSSIKKHISTACILVLSLPVIYDTLSFNSSGTAIVFYAMILVISYNI